MNYTWNIDKINRRKNICELTKYKRGIEAYQLLQNIYNQTFKNEDILIADKTQELDFTIAKHYFGAGIEYIPTSLYDSITDFFFWCEDLSCLSENEHLKKLDLTNTDIITITHDIIASTNNKTILKIFYDLIKHHKERINIQNVSHIPRGATEYVGGITIIDPLSRKSYINLFRNNTIEDIEMFTHEVFHYIYNYLLHYVYKRKDIRLLGELEGQFGSIYSTRFLEKTELKDEAFKLRKNHFNSIITSSYLIMINHILFVTSKDNNFNLDEANKMLNQELKTIEIEITQDEIPTLVSINGLEKMMNIICYLISLDLINKDTNPSDILNIIYSLKLNDSTQLIENLKHHNINFHQTEYQDLRKEYSLTHN